MYSVEFVIDNTTLAFAVTDADKNLTVFMYQPEDRLSNGGQKLIRKADFHLGQHVNYMFRIRAKITDPSTGRLLTGNRAVHGTLFRNVSSLRVYTKFRKS